MNILTILVVALLASGATTPQTRFIDAQVWWNDAGKAPGHQHIGAEVPVGQTISGTLVLRIRLENFHLPGRIDKWSALIAGAGCEESKAGIVFADAAMQTDRFLDCAIDTREVGEDGWHNLTLKAQLVEASGDSRLVRLRIPIKLANGKPVNDRDDNTLVSGEGWIKKRTEQENTNAHGYAHAQIRTGDLPPDAIDGPWTPRVQFGNSRAVPVRGFVALDPNMHAGIEGTRLYLASATKRTTLAISPEGLTVGLHKLFMRADDEGRFADGTVQAVLVVPFDVARIDGR
jgi:hypothetical protein